jgi:hypothetical protein
VRHTLQKGDNKMVDETTKTEKKGSTLTDAQKAAAKLEKEQKEMVNIQKTANAIIVRIGQINDPENNEYPAPQADNLDMLMDYRGIERNAQDCITNATDLTKARVFGASLQSAIDSLLLRNEDSNFSDFKSRTRNTKVLTAEEIALDAADLAWATPMGKKTFALAKGQPMGRKGYTDEVQVVVVNGENQNHNPSNIYDEASMIQMFVAMRRNARLTRQVVVKPEIVATVATPDIGDAQN